MKNNTCNKKQSETYTPKKFVSQIKKVVDALELDSQGAIEFKGIMQGVSSLLYLTVDLSNHFVDKNDDWKPQDSWRVTEGVLGLTGTLLPIGRWKYITPKGRVLKEVAKNESFILSRRVHQVSFNTLKKYDDYQMMDGVFSDLSKAFLALAAQAQDWAGGEKPPNTTKAIVQYSSIGLMGLTEAYINAVLPTQADLEMKRLEAISQVLSSVDNIVPYIGESKQEQENSVPDSIPKSPREAGQMGYNNSHMTQSGNIQVFKDDKNNKILFWSIAAQEMFLCNPEVDTATENPPPTAGGSH
ncbi:MAG: hypothetical protein ACI9OH_001409 [Oleispira sp.]|jgi:hypothetical protein